MIDIDKKGMIDINLLASSQEEEKEEKIGLANEAKKFLLNHKWCNKIVNGWFSMGWGDMLGVFLFEIIPNGDKADQLVWVIGGDLPSVYIDIESAKNGIEALQCYVDLMDDWIFCVKKNQSTDDCYPIGVPATMEYAKMLESRIRIVKEEILQ